MTETNIQPTEPIAPKNRFAFLKKPKYAIAICLAFTVLALVGGFAYSKFMPVQETQAYKSKYIAFQEEVFDTIKENYWEDLKDEQLVGLYVLAAQKAMGGAVIENPPKTREELMIYLDARLNEQESDQKRVKLSSNVADLVLANLQPFARSRLYSLKEQTALQNNLNNITETDQYQVLGVTKEATQSEIEQAYQKKSQEAKKDTTEAGKQILERITHAYNTLADQKVRATYDETKVEPTITGKLLTPEIYYVKMSKFSPTMVDELIAVTQKVDSGDRLNTLIFDLRDNVGGLIDGLPYILGPFIGPDQYAYQFFRKGEKKDFKTVTGWMQSLVRYKKVVVLINENTQSSGEVMAATLKKYNVGLLVGTRTRGWGTVERVYELKNQIDDSQKFSAFIVNNVTLREDGQPIEGKGVEPMINITDPKWETQLMDYYHYTPLVNAIKNLVK